MLHTVLPLEDVLEGIEEEPRPTMQLMLGGVTVESRTFGGFQARVVRVLSTDPRHLRAPLPTGYSNHGVIV